MSRRQKAALEEKAPSENGIGASVIWTVANRPPEVVLEFQGLSEPQELFEALRAIGWGIPPVPPPPANAIDWTPDPTAGTDYTVLPYTVKEFKLVELEKWSVDEELVGTQTLDALVTHGAAISGSRGQIVKHAASFAARQSKQQDQGQPEQVQVQPQVTTAGLPVRQLNEHSQPFDASLEAPASQTASPTSNNDVPALTDLSRANHPVNADRSTAPASNSADSSASVPSPVSVSGAGSDYRTIILLGFPVDSDPFPEPGRWVGVSGRKRLTVTWNELSQPTGKPVPGFKEVSAPLPDGLSAWSFNSDESVLHGAADGQSLVRLVVPDLSVDDAKIRRMNKVLGDAMVTHELSALDGSDAQAVFIQAAVAANSFEMLRSNLCLRLPTAAVRIEAS